MKKRYLFLVLFLAIGFIIFLLTAIISTDMKFKNLQKQLLLGEKYLQELDYENAIVAFEKAIMIDPKNEDAYLCLADVYIAMEDYDKAIEVLESYGAESRLIEDKITSILVLVENHKASDIPVEPVIQEEQKMEVSDENKRKLEVILRCSYDIEQEDYLSTAFYMEDMRTWSDAEEGVVYFYHADNVETPWDNYIGLSWQDEYFVNEHEESINSYIQTETFTNDVDITDEFPNIMEFEVQGIKFEYHLERAWVYPCVGVIVEDEPYTYFQKTDEGYFTADGYIVDFIGTVDCDDSFKTIFETYD